MVIVFILDVVVVHANILVSVVVAFNGVHDYAIEIVMRTNQVKLDFFFVYVDLALHYVPVFNQSMVVAVLFYVQQIILVVTDWDLIFLDLDDVGDDVLVDF